MVCYVHYIYELTEPGMVISTQIEEIESSRRMALWNFNVMLDMANKQ